MLEVEGLRAKRGGRTVIDGVSFSAREGEVLAVIGPNGAGKTTLFNVCCGFVRPDTGMVLRHGAPVRDLRPARLAGMGIARTLQGVGLFRGLSVLENVMVGAERHARTGFWSGLLGLGRADFAAFFVTEDFGQAAGFDHGVWEEGRGKSER